jgi:Uma2 family endonuclease
LDPPLISWSKSPDDGGWQEILEKVSEYLRMGVDLVWVIDPKAQPVHVYRKEMQASCLRLVRQ